MNSLQFNFRIWDFKLKQMSYSYDNDAREFFLHFSGERVIICNDGYSEKNITWDDEFRNRYVVQLCTTLKDLNREFIYDGDILKSNLFSTIYLVKYGKFRHSESLELESGEIRTFTCMTVGFYAEWKNNDGEFESGLMPIASNSKIIGNILETPELITTQV